MLNYNLKLKGKKVTKTKKEKSIKTILKKHERNYRDVKSHLKKEMKSQEDIFKNKMQKRRERSVSRSLNKSMRDL